MDTSSRYQFDGRIMLRILCQCWSLSALCLLTGNNSAVCLSVCALIVTTDLSPVCLSSHCHCWPHVCLATHYPNTGLVFVCPPLAILTTCLSFRWPAKTSCLSIPTKALLTLWMLIYKYSYHILYSISRITQDNRIPFSQQYYSSTTEFPSPSYIIALCGKGRGAGMQGTGPKVDRPTWPHGVDSSKTAVQPRTEGEKDFSFLKENRTNNKT